VWWLTPPEVNLFALASISKYKFMEMNMQSRKRSLKEKLPEIERTLAAVEFLQSRKVWCSEPSHIPNTDD